MPHINLSFAACGFLGIYHLGAASALCKHGRKLLKAVKAFAGASAGSLVASVLLTAPQKIEECNKFTCDFAEEIRRQSLGALTPGYDFMARLRSGVESILPANAHELAHDRLHVSITNARTRRNCLVSRFPSREDLIQLQVDGRGTQPYMYMYPCGSAGKESAPSAGDLGPIPGLGRSPGGGHGNPLQYSCLGNPQGQRSLVGYSPWGHRESDTTEVTKHEAHSPPNSPPIQAAT
ncbi:patatin-like phospholipase domain-containing protein 4 isoform X3 [Odocoileus virginianus]|uniref:Patatin-like phospholipase domain-containing protein 4 isoform X3 n=1 Tax=Odocoileus virginianus TaxID=9874 RepID=A0ABM4HRM7_ODOVR